MDKKKLRDLAYGAAIGDALGVPFEFKERDTFSCTDMVGHGTDDMPAGTFSDDTSMLLATCDSLVQGGKIDVNDMRKRFCAWINTGAYTPDGKAFGVGRTTHLALEAGHGLDGEYDNGNGSLMRIAPLALTDASDEEIREVSAITHAHPKSMEACVAYIGIMRDVLNGKTLEKAIAYNKPSSHDFDFMDDIAHWRRENVASSGYVLDTLGAALWCLLKTQSYKECVLEAVNLGSDTDTTACVAGAFAGVIYGYNSIPAEWIETLRGKDVIDACIA